MQILSSDIAQTQIQLKQNDLTKQQNKSFKKMDNQGHLTNDQANQEAHLYLNLPKQPLLSLQKIKNDLNSSRKPNARNVRNEISSIQQLWDEAYQWWRRKQHQNI
ncbi:UNKNOWN [Stylonychia lemnae]|uniref:Uncharacterized protein n=1 Tax=Stylonychia lemnae TaxID=5949 RepID=A0A077ZP46_STYLE|nr:UNKNOWN [Stylonychia lemnae]|eukprot:CDW71160.1 UNKNOWN [Stylonychia lemnae]